MKRFDPRIVLGLLLLLGGGLLLLQSMGYVANASSFFWGGVFALAGVAFLSLLPAGQWWAAFPGMTLIGLGALVFFGERLGEFGGMIFLGAIALSFWIVYFLGRERWWALIPAGVLSTLAIVTLMPERIGPFGTGGVFFIGLALTFLLVALATGFRGAFYPAAILGVLGLLATVSALDFANYVWALALIVIGGWLVVRFFIRR
jgi:hypothetical protein